MENCPFSSLLSRYSRRVTWLAATTTTPATGVFACETTVPVMRPLDWASVPAAAAASSARTAQARAAGAGKNLREDALGIVGLLLGRPLFEKGQRASRQAVTRPARRVVSCVLKSEVGAL
jgi:hypothetical protein